MAINGVDYVVFFSGAHVAFATAVSQSTRQFPFFRVRTNPFSHRNHAAGDPFHAWK